MQKLELGLPIEVEKNPGPQAIGLMEPKGQYVPPGQISATTYPKAFTTRFGVLDGEPLKS
jgi:hypothetical protein